MLLYHRNYFQRLNSFMIKKTLVILLCSSALLFQTQETEKSKKSLYLKGNALFVPLSMINLGLEYQLGKKTTLQADGFISPWKSVLNNHLQIYMAHLEGRYYFEEAFKGWYFGANAGLGVYDMSKWNYWDTGKFQRGFNYMLGVSIGYQWQWKENWNIDLYVGGGNSQGFYRGYVGVPPDNHFFRYDDPKWERNWNRSGEWIPYRGGLMISYKIR